MKEFRIGEPGGRETRQTQCQEAFQSSCMANTGQHFNSSFFCAGSVWWSVLEKLHRSLHCQTHLKTCPFTVGWVVLGKGHEFLKKKSGSSVQKISHLHPTCSHLSSVSFEKRGARNTEKQRYFPPRQDEWPLAGGQERICILESSFLKCT